MDITNMVQKVPTEATRQLRQTNLIYMMAIAPLFPTEGGDFTYILNMQGEDSLFIPHDTTAWGLVTG